MRAWLATRREAGKPPPPAERIGHLEPEEAIARLALVGSSEAVAVCREILFEPTAGPSARQIALFALGFIGSEGAVEAIAEFERQHIADWRLLGHVHPDDPQSHVLATCAGADGAQWALFEHRFLPGARYWLAERLGDGRWGEPLLVTPALGSAELALSWEGGALKLDGAMTLDLERMRADQDRDGLTDALEMLLPTSWLTRDTDRDGVRDDVDGNPLTPKHEETEETAARQAVFSAFYAIGEPRGTLYVRTGGEWSDQEFYGYDGMLVPTIDLAIEGQRTLMGIGVTMAGPDAATAEIGEWVGGTAAWGQTAYLRRRFGRGVVVWAQLDWIS